jgi:hypothetical protein
LIQLSCPQAPRLCKQSSTRSSCAPRTQLRRPLTAVTDLAIEIAREGREGREIGTLFHRGRRNPSASAQPMSHPQPPRRSSHRASTGRRSRYARDAQRTRATRRRLHHHWERNRAFRLSVLRVNASSEPAAAGARYPPHCGRINLRHDRCGCRRRVRKLDRPALRCRNTRERNSARTVAAPPMHAPTSPNPP